MFHKKDIEQPKARKEAKSLEKHGDTRIDNYYWLNKRDDQEVLDYLHAENAYTKAMFGHLESFQERNSEIFQRHSVKVFKTPNVKSL